MIFSSIFFLCVFLPALWILYSVVPKRFRNYVLLVASLFFYAFGEPKYVLIMIASITFNYIMGVIIGKISVEKKALRVSSLIFTIVVNLGTLALFKYADFLIKNLNGISGVEIPMLNLALPIGISFYTFQTLSYVIDVYRGNVKVQKNIVKFALYVTMFPQLIAGPIVRYSDIEAELDNRTLDVDSIHNGLVRFIFGLGKKVLIANQMGHIYEMITTSGGMTQVSSVMAAVAFTLQIYYDFSGYSDMAIGLGEMFGFHFMENFKYPYESQSITEFWSRWHISLSTWFKEYVYIPLGGNRKGKGRQILNLFIVWALTGIWHGAGWNFLLWGLYYFLLLVLEKFFLGRWLKKWPEAIRHIYTMVFVVIGWVIFSGDDINTLKSLFLGLFGIGVPFINSQTIYELLTHITMLGIGIVGSTSLPKVLAAKALRGREGSRFIVGRDIVCVLILAFSIAFLIGDSYNPFLYFRF